ncbi:MAG: hypothetical protein ABIQ40_14410 [Bacteroidia bacterium]
MKKIISCLLPLICLLLPLSAQTPVAKPSDLVADNYKGNVKQVRQTYCEMIQKNGKDTIGQEYQTVDFNFQKNYNEAGYLTSEIFYSRGSTMLSHAENIYDAEGHKIEESAFTEEDALDYKTVRKFSNRGFLMEEKRFTIDNEEPEKWVYEPDPVGKPVKVIWYDNEGALLETRTYTYDGFGNCIQEDAVDENGKALRKVICLYDSRHLKTAMDIYGPDGIVMTKTKYQYEYRGKLSQEQVFDNNGKLVEKNVFDYNENGDQTEWTSFDRTGFVAYKYTYTYEYDANGNWTSRIESNNGKATYIKRREITYY